MRTAVILVRRHDAEAFELLSGPEVPIMEQHAAMREFLAVGLHPKHDDYAEVQLWTSDGGMQRSAKFMSPEAHETFCKKQEADQNAHQEYLDSLAEQAEDKAEKADASDAKKKVQAKAKKQAA